MQLNSKHGMILGKKDNGELMVSDGYQHLLLLAPTGAGKGVTFVIPNLLFWEESAIVHDIKGENYELTSGWRAKQGQKIFVVIRPAETGGAHGSLIRISVRTVENHVPSARDVLPLKHLRLGRKHEVVQVEVNHFWRVTKVAGELFAARRVVLSTLELFRSTTLDVEVLLWHVVYCDYCQELYKQDWIGPLVHPLERQIRGSSTWILSLDHWTVCIRYSPVRKT